MVNIVKLHKKALKSYPKKRLLKVTFAKGVPPYIKSGVDECNVLFSYILLLRRPEYKKLCPYIVRVKPLKAKNQWSAGTYVAIDRENGTLDLYLNIDKVCDMPEFPVYALVRVLFHEFRHKIQANTPAIASVANYPNWANFNVFMQKQFGKTQDEIDHIFHELMPKEADADMFAAEMTGLKFTGNAFDINDQTLNLLIKNPCKH